jgi:ribosomal protein S18 acetylase RimI-like enzyme
MEHMSKRTRTRALAAADLDPVVAIDRELSGRPRRDFYARRLRTLAEDPQSVVAMVAEGTAGIEGFAFAHVLDGEFGGTAPVGMFDAIGVAPAARRKGVASSLLAGLEAALAARGVREVHSQAGWTEHGLAAFLASAGFRLSSRLVLEHSLDRLPDDDFSWEELPVRSMMERDLSAIIRLDRKITGRDRTAYYARKAAEALKQSAVRVSLVAEMEGQFAGFLMARVDFGEFGRTEPTAVLDTLGVDPAFARRHVGRALLEQLLLNLASLRAERVVTEVEWNDLGLLAFLARTGFTHAQRLAFEKAIAA